MSGTAPAAMFPLRLCSAAIAARSHAKDHTPAVSVVLLMREVTMFFRSSQWLGRLELFVKLHNSGKYGIQSVFTRNTNDFVNIRYDPIRRFTIYDHDIS